MPAGLGLIVQAILGMIGSQSLLHVGALSVRLSEGFLVLKAVCSVRSSCVLYLVVQGVKLQPNVQHACGPRLMHRTFPFSGKSTTPPLPWLRPCFLKPFFFPRTSLFQGERTLPRFLLATPLYEGEHTRNRS